MQIEAFQAVWLEEGRALVLKLKERELSGLPMLAGTKWEVHLGMGHGSEVGVPPCHPMLPECGVWVYQWCAVESRYSSGIVGCTDGVVYNMGGGGER